MRYNLMPGLASYLQLHSPTIWIPLYSKIPLSKSFFLKQNEQRQKVRQGLAWNSGWDRIQEKMVPKRREKCQPQHIFHAMTWEPLLIAENLYCDSTYTIYTPLSKTWHLCTKIISEGLGPHKYGEMSMMGRGVIFETLCPTQHKNLADHNIRF